jgi:hypothetical protein
MLHPGAELQAGPTADLETVSALDEPLAWAELHFHPGAGWESTGPGQQYRLNLMCVGQPGRSGGEGDHGIAQPDRMNRERYSAPPRKFFYLLEQIGYTVQKHVPVATQWLHGPKMEKACYLLNSRLSICSLVGRAGVEPTTNGLKVRCSTN